MAGNVVIPVSVVGLTPKKTNLTLNAVDALNKSNSKVK